MKNLKLFAAVAVMMVTGTLALSEACTDRLDGDNMMAFVLMSICAASVFYIAHYNERHKDEDDDGTDGTDGTAE